MEILVLSSADGKWKPSDWPEWVNTDSGREMTKNAQLVDRNVRKLRLNTGEDSLILPALEAQRRMKGGEAFDVLHSGGDDRVPAYRVLNATKSAWAKLEQGAIALLSDSRG